jgi:hypothetical protein
MELAMPVFYFDVRDGQNVLHDQEGTDLPNLAAALTEAHCVARDLAIEELKRGSGVDGRQIEILDAERRKCAVFPVREIVK